MHLYMTFVDYKFQKNFIKQFINIKIYIFRYIYKYNNKYIYMKQLYNCQDLISKVLILIFFSSMLRK